MEFAHVVMFENIVMLLISVFILYRTSKYRRRNLAYKVFFQGAVGVVITQLASTLVRMFKNGLIPANPVLMYITYTIMFATLAMPVCFFFQYLIYVYKPDYRPKKLTAFFIFLPLGILMALAVISPFFGLIFTIDSNGVYHRAPFFYIEFFGSFIYIIAGLVLIFVGLFLKRIVKLRRIVISYITFSSAMIIGTCIQAFTPFDGGYSQVGIAVGMIFLYIEMYIGQVEENDRLAELASHAQELKEKEESLSQQLAVINCMAKRYFCAYWIDIDNNYFEEIFTLPYMSRVLGKSGEAQKTLTIAFEKMIKAESKEAMADFHNLNHWKNYLKGKDFYSVEYKGITSGWSKGTIFVAKRDDNGDATHVLYVLETIHEQKAAEEELARRLADIESLNNKLSATSNIMANAGFGLWEIRLKDGAQPEMRTNDKMKELLGIETGVVLSDAEVYDFWYSRIEPLAVASVEASVKEMMRGKYSENTYKWRHPKKGIIYTRCGGTAELLSDGTYSLRGYHGDVTKIVKEERRAKEELAKAREEAESANAAKTAFLFNMSHDIRTPMNAIVGFRSLLEKHQDDPKKRAEYLKKIESASNVLMSIINNVLEMARIEKGAMELEEVPWSLEQFHDSLLSVFIELMSEKGIQFTTEIDVVNRYLYCDTIKLREIFLNLLSNAYKYTNPAGKVHLQIEEIPCFEDGYATIRTTITDTGIGMSEEFLPRIFDEFARENVSVDNRIEGTGLGMPIVKKLVDLMRGTIEITSKQGVGTTIVVTINHRIARKEDLIPETTIEVDQSLFERKKVLVAEDNDLNAEITMEILREMGISVERAIDGVDCIEIIKNNPVRTFDLVLMDIQMPHMNGYEATRAIRALEDEEKKNIPIIALTANAFTEDKARALRCGMNGHLAKPIDVSKLIEELSKQFSK